MGSDERDQAPREPAEEETIEDLDVPDDEAKDVPGGHGTSYDIKKVEGTGA
jgi:hypothetical protein